MRVGTVTRGVSVCGLTRVASVVGPAPRDVWDRLVASDPRSLPSQTPRWLDAICAVAGLEDASRLYETADGRLLVLPLVRRRLLGMALAEASLPYGWGPGGLVAEGGRVLPEDIRTVFADLADRRAPRVTLRPSPATGRVWDAAVPTAVVRRPHMAQTLDLGAAGFAEVWRTRFKPDTRNRVRRAERAGVLVERDDTGRLVPVFQELYQRSVARWARRDGQPLAVARCPAAAIVVLLGTASASYWRGAMDEQVVGRTYANYLLHRTAIEDACAAGCRAYHMGDSAPGSQLALFKSRFGAEERPYASYQLERLPFASAASAARGAVGGALRRRRGRS